MERTTQNLLAQTTTDGVQREWSGGYHRGVLRDAVEIMERMESVGIDIPAEYRERIRGMYDYIFWIATPHLDFPMFGDTSRKASSGKDRTGLQLYGTLLEGSRVTGDPLYEARARLIETARTGADRRDDVCLVGQRIRKGSFLRANQKSLEDEFDTDGTTRQGHSHQGWLSMSKSVHFSDCAFTVSFDILRLFYQARRTPYWGYLSWIAPPVSPLITLRLILIQFLPSFCTRV